MKIADTEPKDVVGEVKLRLGSAQRLSTGKGSKSSGPPLEQTFVGLKHSLSL